MRKWLVALVLLLSIALVGVPVGAAVASTADPTAGDTIYIAGNPDLYPLEYYDEKTERYEGILPTLYQDIGEETGITFSYIAANGEDRQKKLAKNCQVEIVSAYLKGEMPVTHETELFSYRQGEQKYTVCVGFTKIADPDLIAAVETAIRNAGAEQWMAAAMVLEEQPSHTTAIWWLAAVIFLLVVALVWLIVERIKKHRQKEAQNATEMVDPMTGIGNLTYFEDCYANHVSDAMRPLYYTAYIAIDIEKIETYFGLPQSEELQRYAATTLTGALGDNDFAARIDNGVFAVCFMCPDADRAIKNTTLVVNHLNDYSRNYANDNGVRFRCGVYPLDQEHISCETMLYNARQGYLYAVNEKLDICLCDKDVLDRVSLKSRLQKKISTAIDKDEFQVYLQFVWDVKQQKLCGAEVLSRWHNPEEGVLSPTDYIEDMKTAGMIEKLDYYVFERTCRLLHSWERTAFDSLFISCNFTRTTLSSPQFVQHFEEILSRYTFDRKKLYIELTEDSLVGDRAVAYKNILAIKKQGCAVALDDFGSGYTSFSDLCDYPMDMIKIDRSMVQKAGGSRGNAVLLSIIRMAHTLGIQVLCEGVETEAESQKVTDADSDYIQGFFYSRVLPIDNAIDYYRKQQQ